MEIFEVLVTGIALACPADYPGVLRLLFSIDFAILGGALRGVHQTKSATTQLWLELLR